LPQCCSIFAGWQDWEVLKTFTLSNQRNIPEDDYSESRRYFLIFSTPVVKSTYFYSNNFTRGKELRKAVA